MRSRVQVLVILTALLGGRVMLEWVLKNRCQREELDRLLTSNTIACTNIHINMFDDVEVRQVYKIPGDPSRDNKMILRAVHRSHSCHRLKWGPLPPNDVRRIALYVREGF